MRSLLIILVRRFFLLDLLQKSMDAYRLKSEAIQTKPAYAGFKDSPRRRPTLRERFAKVFVAAISNRQVYLQEVK
jgi:hypothetical protein